MRRAAAILVLKPWLLSLLTAQQNNNAMRPTIPSPTAASLGKFGDVPVSFYTGTPEVSIPLFTAKGKTLALPISLSYHASGIKIDEIGGWVGMGWALEAGGVITRTVRGIPDEKAEGYFNKGHSFYDPQYWVTPPPTPLLASIKNGDIDGEPDQFFFNFAGQTGEIVGGPQTQFTNNPNVYVTIPFRKWRVVPHIGIDPYDGYTAIDYWVITTEDGTKYTFSAVETHTDRWWQYNGPGSHEYFPYASSWYLTQIQNVGGDVITLTYSTYTAEHYTGLSREKFSEISGTNCQLPGYLDADGSSLLYDIHSESFVHALSVYSISTAAYTVTFTTRLRTDAVAPAHATHKTPGALQELRLDTITIRTAAPENALVKQFVFEYDMSIGYRLTLKKLYEVGVNGDSLPPYTFTYSGPTLPQRAQDVDDNYNGTASFAIDHWGYFNGKTGNTTLIPAGLTNPANLRFYSGADRRPDPLFMKAGVLTKITYPTGGFTDFSYDANEYSTIAAGGSPLLEFPNHYNPAASVTGSSNSTTTRDFVIGGVDPTVTVMLTVHIGMTVPPFSTTCPPSCYVQLKQGATVLATYSTDNSGQDPSVRPTWTLNRGVTYTLLATNGSGVDRQISIQADWDERVEVPKKYAGGLRIAQVRTADGMAADGIGNVTVRNYSYYGDDVDHSSGIIGFEPTYGHAHSDPQCGYFSRSTMSRIPLGSGPLIGYRAVKESRGASGEFGTTRRTFIAGGDFPSGNMWPYLRYTLSPWKRGQQDSVADYDPSNRVQRVVRSIDTLPVWPQTTRTFRGLAVDVYSGAFTIYMWRQFLVESGLKLPRYEITTLYDTTGTSSFWTQKTFSFGNPNHAQLTEVAETNSSSSLQRITRMRYPADYAAGGLGDEAGALTKMQDVSASGAHMPGVAIERTVSVKSGASDRVVQADITTFKEFASGQILPYRHYVLNSPSPLP